MYRFVKYEGYPLVPSLILTKDSKPGVWNNSVVPFGGRAACISAPVQPYGEKKGEFFQACRFFFNSSLLSSLPILYSVILSQIVLYIKSNCHFFGKIGKIWLTQKIGS